MSSEVLLLAFYEFVNPRASPQMDQAEMMAAVSAATARTMGRKLLGARILVRQGARLRTGTTVTDEDVSLQHHQRHHWLGKRFSCVHPQGVGAGVFVMAFFMCGACRRAPLPPVPC